MDMQKIMENCKIIRQCCINVLKNILMQETDEERIKEIDAHLMRLEAK